MTRQIILLIVMLGFFLTPTLTYACGKPAEKTEKSCCEKGVSISDKKDCCKTHSENDNNNDGCEGKCGHPSCHCPITPLTIALPFVSKEKHNFYFVEKQSIPYTETYTSSGFCSIWLPPKIG
ncbi:MAG: hypothetical protein KA767_05085 [Saprospiraceae bacterium]|nr:hypothetical protein [Saprospiraceae bacterium]